jgi:hypothetical protein
MHMSASSFQLESLQRPITLIMDGLLIKDFKMTAIFAIKLLHFVGLKVSHHQNSIAEQKIKELTLGARTLLLHAKRMLPEYISTILWPFALKCAEDRLNHLVHHSNGHTPYETLANIDSSSIKVSNFHTFGSPCYVLDQRLQTRSSMIPKWEPRARMGIYVGWSPSHASNAALVLNP